MVRIYVALEDFDQNERWAFSFESYRELVRFLRKLGKGQLKRKKITKIFGHRGGHLSHELEHMDVAGHCDPQGETTQKRD